MNLLDYIRDKIRFLCFFAFFLLFLFCFLRITGYPAAYALLFLSLAAGLTLLYGGIDYCHKKTFFDHLLLQLNQLDKPYLIGEIMEKSPCLTDRLYRQVIRVSNRSVIESIHTLEKEKQEYREYIESWIHEVKAPLTSINLMCANQLSAQEEDGHFARKLLQETEAIENAVEQALYYARSDEVYRDFLITPCCLNDIVKESVTRCRRLLTACHMKVELHIPASCMVYCDGIWLVFILSQLLRNSAQYKKGDCGNITITAKERPKQVLLSVRDEGTGIPDNELSRIFEKGFTGSNGRKTKSSTGMGLYLSKKLCQKLGLSIRAHSCEGVFTEILLEIPREENLPRFNGPDSGRQIFQNCKAEES